MSYNQSIGAIGSYPNLSGQDYQYLAALMNTQSASNPSFQGAAATTSSQSVTPSVVQPTVAEEPQKSHTARNILIGIGAAALIVGGICYAKGDKGLKFAERLKDGWKHLFKSAEAGAKTATTSAKDAVTKGKRTITEVVDSTTGKTKTVVSLPDEKNIISAVSNKENVGRSIKTANKELSQIGEKAVNNGALADRLADTTGKTLKDGNELRSFVMEHTTRKGDIYRVISADGGKKLTVLDAKGNVVNWNDAPGLLKNIEQKVQDVWAHKTDLKTLKQVVIRNTDKTTGLVSTIKVGGYTHKGGKLVADAAKQGKETFLTAVSDRFAINSETVMALRNKDKAFSDALTAYAKDGGKGLNMLRGDVRVKDLGYLTFDNSGNLLSIKNIHGQVLDATKNDKAFNAFCFKNKESIEKAAATDKTKWLNRIFEI